MTNDDLSVEFWMTVMTMKTVGQAFSMDQMHPASSTSSIKSMPTASLALLTGFLMGTDTILLQ